jgi:hypothetical protein
MVTPKVTETVRLSAHYAPAPPPRPVATTPVPRVARPF